MEIRLDEIVPPWGVWPTRPSARFH